MALRKIRSSYGKCIRLLIYLYGDIYPSIISPGIETLPDFVTPRSGNYVSFFSFLRAAACQGRSRTDGGRSWAMQYWAFSNLHRGALMFINIAG